MEVWKPIEGCKYYYVSNLGRVKKETDNSVYMLKLRTDKRGYQNVSFPKNRSSGSQLVHRLVVTAFVPNPHNYKRIKHLNGDISDNRAENLVWTKGHRTYKQRESASRFTDPKKLEQAKELLGQGMSIYKVRKKVGIGHATLKRYGIIKPKAKA